MMSYGGTLLLVMILVVMVAILLLGIRGISHARATQKELEKEQERLVLKSIGDGQRSIASALISIQADLADIRNRIASLEGGGRDGK